MNICVSRTTRRFAIIYPTSRLLTPRISIRQQLQGRHFHKTSTRISQDSKMVQDKQVDTDIVWVHFLDLSIIPLLDVVSWFLWMWKDCTRMPRPMARRSRWHSQHWDWSMSCNMLISPRMHRRRSGSWRSIVSSFNFVTHSCFLFASLSSYPARVSYIYRELFIVTGKKNVCWLITANGRIPAILDRTTTPDGEPQEIRVFEGMAIQLYLVQKYDKDGKLSYPFDSDKWVFLLDLRMQIWIWGWLCSGV